MGVWKYGNEVLIIFTSLYVLEAIVAFEFENIKHSHTPILPYSHTFVNLAP
jgi:hypothetical protein